MEGCIFCQIVQGTIPSKKLYEDEEILAFEDLHPQAPVHLLVIPKKHISTLMDLEEEDSPLAGRLLFRAQALAQEKGCGDEGARFVINCKNHGGQTVDHLHIHVLGGRPLTWPPG